MNPGLQTVVLLLTITATYLWFQWPQLGKYTPQIFAGAVLIYFLIKKIRKANLLHLMPGNASPELIPLTFTILLIIGYTGNLTSIFYPLTYVLLFLLVMTSDTRTAIVTGLAITLFHYILTPEITGSDLGPLVSLPVLLIFFLFAKHQYTASQIDKAVLKAREEALSSVKSDKQVLAQFIDEFLKPKLKVIDKLLTEETPDVKVARSQISLLTSESDKIVGRTKDKVGVEEGAAEVVEVVGVEVMVQTELEAAVELEPKVGVGVGVETGPVPEPKAELEPEPKSPSQNPTEK